MKTLPKSYYEPEEICRVCTMPMELLGDDTGFEPGPDTVRCSCREIVHDECFAKSVGVCKKCAYCDTDGCKEDTTHGTWVIKGSIEPAPAIGTHAQELLCPRCLEHRRLAVKNAVAA